MDVQLSIQDALWTRADPPPAVPASRRRSSRLLIGVMSTIFSAVTLGAIALGVSVVIFTDQLQQSGTWAVPARPTNIRVLASDGHMISDRGQMGGQTVSLSNLPPYVSQALVAIEDKRFTSHFGIDPIGLLAAAVDNLTAGHITRGGSTLTQQLAKNLFLSPEQTLGRKAQEALLALWLERTFSKSEILEMYLNRVYFGSGAYGIEAAAHRYFDKPAAQLSVGEAAMMAGLVKAPSRLNPLYDLDASQERARIVLQEMAKEGYVSNSDIEPSAIASPSAISSDSALSGHIADWIETLAEAYVGELPSDIIVRTSIDRNLQQLAETAITQAVAASGDSRHFSEGALVAMTPDGMVKALVGGVDYRTSQYNRAVTARRQPGSAFKTFVYLAALEKGYSPDTMADDSLFEFEGWSPRNATRRYQGPVTLREAFAHSLNTVAARLAIDVTPATVAQTAARLGISSQLSAVPSIALGTSEISLLELTAAYAPFANGGVGVVANAIESIETIGGEVLYRNPASGPGQVIAPDIAATMNAMLVHSWQRTSGRPFDIAGLPVGGKTGTSQRGRDAVFVGYTPNLVTGVWLGNDDDGKTDLSGGNVPLDAWYDFMSKAH